VRGRAGPGPTRARGGGGNQGREVGPGSTAEKRGRRAASESLTGGRGSSPPTRRHVVPRGRGRGSTGSPRGRTLATGGAMTAGVSDSVYLFGIKILIEKHF
jgi:hypothetical protein